jgi:hypothetical protein
MNNINLVTGRYGIGPIDAAKLSRRMSLLRSAQTFLTCKECALNALKRGDRDGARFWGQQARADWNSIRHSLAQPTL